MWRAGGGGLARNPSPRARHGAGLFIPASLRHCKPMKGGWVYIMANRFRGGMYIGVTADLAWRVQQHRNGTGSFHVAETGKTRLVYAERHEEIAPAIAREKLVKKWRREWSFDLIEADNPDWLDLWNEWFREAASLEN